MDIDDLAPPHQKLKAPFPWFGGKSRAAHLIWPRLGDTLNYVEPFAGSLAMLLARPFPVRTETVNDKDCYLANFWRTLAAIERDPDVAEEVAYWADWPVNECDLHARHRWLVSQVDFREKMMSDPDYFSPKIAGWWVWGLCAWIGSGWCSTERVNRHSGMRLDGTTERKRVNVNDRGVNSVSVQRPNLRPKQGIEGLSQKIIMLRGDEGAAGAGIHASAFERKTGGLVAYMEALAQRLRRVRVACGDWQRIMGPSVTFKIGMTAVLLDPPYSEEAGRQEGIYAQDCLSVAHDVRRWCLEIITDKQLKFTGPRFLHPKLRIALCGYEGEHDELTGLGWDCVAWKAHGGYAGQRKGEEANENADKERIWFSPNCIPATVATGKKDTNDYNHLFTLQEKNGHNGTGSNEGQGSEGPGDGAGAL